MLKIILHVYIYEIVSFYSPSDVIQSVVYKKKLSFYIRFSLSVTFIHMNSPREVDQFHVLQVQLLSGDQK